MNQPILNVEEKKLISELTKIVKQIKSGRVGFITKYKFTDACDAFLKECENTQHMAFKKEAEKLIQLTVFSLDEGQHTNLMTSTLYRQYQPLLAKTLIEFERDTLLEQVEATPTQAKNKSLKV